MCILESRLTAIDEAVFMAENGHTGPINLVSRFGQLPKVQGPLVPFERTLDVARELEETRAGAMIILVRRLQEEIERAAKGDWFRVPQSNDVLTQLGPMLNTLGRAEMSLDKPYR